MFFGVVKARPFKLLEDHPLPKFELELLNLGFSSNGSSYSGAFFFFFIILKRKFWNKTRITYCNLRIKETGINENRMITKELAGERWSAAVHFVTLRKLDLNVPSPTFELLPTPFAIFVLRVLPSLFLELTSHQ